jgi:hypothetical protein
VTQQLRWRKDGACACERVRKGLASLQAVADGVGVHRLDHHNNGFEPRRA